MGYDVLYDKDKCMAALVADDPPYALGPVVAADTHAEAVEAMDGFISGLESPPDKTPTIKLMQDWNLYIQALYEMADEVQEPPQPDPTTPPARSAGGSADGPALPGSPASEPSTSTDGSADYGTGAPVDPTAPDGHTPPDSTDANTGANVGSEPCWACKDTPGKFFLGDEEHPCSVCAGRGYLVKVS